MLEIDINNNSSFLILGTNKFNIKLIINSIVKKIIPEKIYYLNRNDEINLILLQNRHEKKKILIIMMYCMNNISHVLKADLIYQGKYHNTSSIFVENIMPTLYKSMKICIKYIIVEKTSNYYNIVFLHDEFEYIINMYFNNFKELMTNTLNENNYLLLSKNKINIITTINEYIKLIKYYLAVITIQRRVRKYIWRPNSRLVNNLLEEDIKLGFVKI